ncbi:hypothetical protein A6R68_19858, partial [Neotoma lepida]
VPQQLSGPPPSPPNNSVFPRVKWVLSLGEHSTVAGHGQLALHKGLEARCTDFALHIFQVMAGHTLAKDYSVMGTLGEGAWGKVKVALHLMTQTLVAIKILERDPIADICNMISSETELLKDLHHPHTVQLLQVIETKRKTYLVMECAARVFLLKCVTKSGHLEGEEAWTLFRELTLAIKYIHSHNITHRDITAENILLDWEGHIKLSDFSLGKRFASGKRSRASVARLNTVLGDTQYEGLPTDIWSLGVLLFLLVTGHLPFSETERSKRKSLILSSNCCIPHHLSPELKDLLNRIMTVDPTKRPSIMEVMAHPWLHHEEDTLISSAEILRELRLYGTQQVGAPARKLGRRKEGKEQYGAPEQ